MIFIYQSIYYQSNYHYNLLKLSIAHEANIHTFAIRTDCKPIQSNKN